MKLDFYKLYFMLAVCWVASCYFAFDQGRHRGTIEGELKIRAVITPMPTQLCGAPSGESCLSGWPPSWELHPTRKGTQK